MIEVSPKLLSTLHRASLLTRDEIWSGESVYRPIVRKAFAEFPRIGYIGEQYRPGGWLLVGSNGNSTENQDESRFSSRDKQHVKLMKEFRQNGTKRAYDELNKFEHDDILSWDMNWVISGTLQRLDMDLENIAVINVIPFSTNDSPSAKSRVWENACRLYFRPLAECLEPGKIVWLGKAAQERSSPYLDHRPATYEFTVSRQRNLTFEKKFEALERGLARLSKDTNS